MIQKISLVFLIVLIGCQSPTSEETVESYETKYNTGIDEEVRSAVKAMNDQLIRFIVNNNSAEISKLSSDLLLNNDPDGFSEVIELASGLVQNTTYTILAEYYTNSSNSELEIKIDHSKGIEKDTNDFIINYISPNKESYVSLLLIDAGYGERMVSVIYSKYSTDWKIDYLHFSNYSLYNKTATEYYYASERAYKNKPLLETFTLALLSKTCNQPGGEIFTYDIQTKMEAFYQKIFAAVEENYIFPIALTHITTKPSITGVSLIPLANYQYIPSVTYQTEIDLSNEEAIHTECDQINEKLNQILPGFTWEFNQVLFRVFDKKVSESGALNNLNLIKAVH